MKTRLTLIFSVVSFCFCVFWASVFSRELKGVVFGLVLRVFFFFFGTRVSKVENLGFSLLVLVYACLCYFKL